jgi:hypothetical protein
MPTVVAENSIFLAIVLLLNPYAAMSIIFARPTSPWGRDRDRVIDWSCVLTFCDKSIGLMGLPQAMSFSY